MERGCPRRRPVRILAAIATIVLLGCDVSPTSSLPAASGAPENPGPSGGQLPPQGAPTYTAVDVDGSDVCAVDTSGAVRCWGSNDAGELDAPMGSFQSVTLADYFGCAISVERTVACWGEMGAPPVEMFNTPMNRISGSWGGLCGIRLDGRAVCRGYAEAGFDADASYRDIATGGYGSCALGIDGRVVCWNGTEEDVQPVPAPEDRFRAISSGSFHCGISMDDSLACWSTSAEEPLQDYLQPPEGSFKALSAGSELGCAIRTDDTLACWGTAATVDEAGAPLVPTGRYLAVSAGSQSACAIRLDRQLVCWGDGFAGVAVPGDPVGVTLDVQAGAPVRVLDVSRGWSTTCAVLEDGSLTCWGSEVGPVPAGAFARVDVGFDQACGLRSDGSMECWYTTANLIGASAAFVPHAGTFIDFAVDDILCGVRPGGALTCQNIGGGAVPVPPGLYSDVSVTGTDGCALRIDANIVCWGDVAAAGTEPAGPFVAVTSASPACGIRPDGTMQCWAIEDGTLLPSAPGRFAAAERACGLHTDGTIECWWTGEFDEEGNMKPEASPPSGTFKAVDDHCAVHADGFLVCWGTDGLVPAMPSAYVAGREEWVETGDVTWSWGGSGISPVQAFDVDASWMRAEGGYTRWFTRTAETSATVPGTPGTWYCLKVRAHDRAGLVSAPAQSDCIHAPYDDDVFDLGPGWERVEDGALYEGSALRATQHGATLKLRLAPARLALVVTTCPTCGEISVSVGDARKVISLRSETRAERTVIELPVCEECSDDPYLVTMRIQVTSTDRPVIIDGIATAGYWPD